METTNELKLTVYMHPIGKVLQKKWPLHWHPNNFRPIHGLCSLDKVGGGGFKPRVWLPMMSLQHRRIIAYPMAESGLAQSFGWGGVGWGGDDNKIRIETTNIQPPVHAILLQCMRVIGGLGPNDTCRKHVLGENFTWQLKPAAENRQTCDGVRVPWPPGWMLTCHK